jgi:hypothetical protein
MGHGYLTAVAADRPLAAGLLRRRRLGARFRARTTASELGVEPRYAMASGTTRVSGSAAHAAGSTSARSRWSRLIAGVTSSGMLWPG